VCIRMSRMQLVDVHKLGALSGGVELAQAERRDLEVVAKALWPTL
jgi:hypothetical protein